MCVDYVTEKLFNALGHYVIPVVFGGANYSEIAPPRSYIDALSFQSPKHLAEYLVRLSKNYTEYAAYFAWKEHFDVDFWRGGDSASSVKSCTITALEICRDHFTGYFHDQDWLTFGLS
ncbi:hypothetical protein MTO96_004431 [Rhipicephalus appendiculatus]